VSGKLPYGTKRRLPSGRTSHHTKQSSEIPDDATLLDVLAGTVPDESIRHCILADKPSKVTSSLEHEAPVEELAPQMS